MTSGRTRASILVAGILTIVLTAPPAHAGLSTIQKACFQAIAKASQGFVKGKLKLLQKCKNKNLKDASCPTPDQVAIDKLEAKLAAGIDKGCTFVPVGTNLKRMSYPGPCVDVTPLTEFTESDLKECIKTSHTNIIAEMFDLEYDPGVTPAVDDLKCQSEVAKQSGALVSCILKNVQKCRNDVMNGKLLDVGADACATDDVKTHAAIQKCEDKLTAGIVAKCDPTQIGSLKVCTLDSGTAEEAAACLIDAHTVRVDGPEITVPLDLVDYEYANRGGACGDNIINNLNEECDGTDDDACPGQCGTAAVPDGFFACLCKTKPRMVILEHANADTDNGWVGTSVDGAVPEGGGYLIDLYDCDGNGLCIAGPNCSLAPHSPCSVPGSIGNGPPFPPANYNSGTTSDSICADLGQGVCRKERTATGPHCFQDITKKCAENNPKDPVCDAPGDFCVHTFHGSPVPQAAGGVAVCNVSVFSEDAVGTVNIQDGTSSVRLRQRATTWNPISQSKPCPVCGGFCASGLRERCTVDADCLFGSGPCVTNAVCSDGPRQDKPCRTTAPFGGNVPFFGVTSFDCPPGLNAAGVGPGPLTVTGYGLDIDANPRTTGTVSMAPSVPCTGAGFTNNTCLGGTSEGRPCTVASECPGGTCTPQCFCAGQVKPNDCDRACVIPGGAFPDKEGCVDDTECSGGFCHPADCRLDPLDLTSNQEGICSSGPSTRFCSHTTYRPCDNGTGDLGCRPPLCPVCQPDETCGSPRLRACFINSGILRIGTPRDANGEYGCKIEI